MWLFEVFANVGRYLKRLAELEWFQKIYKRIKADR
jgi:hypothetical protein